MKNGQEHPINSIKPPYFPEARAVFFDLDKTLISDDSDWLFSLWCLKRHHSGSLKNLFGVLSLAMGYVGGHLDPLKYENFQQHRLSRVGHIKYNSQALQFFKEKGEELIIPLMKDLVDQYKKKGIPTIMITAQEKILARPFAQAFEVDILLSNEVQETPGKNSSIYTSKQPFCFAQGKVDLAEEILKNQVAGNLSLADCAFYSDSINDLPLLEKAGMAGIINPDKKLKKMAKLKGWPSWSC